MKKLLLSLFMVAAAFLTNITFPSFAENVEAFSIDERTVFNDMSRSYLQGYEPSVSFDRLNLVLPIHSDIATGNISAELIAENEAGSPFKPQSMSARTQRVKDGLWAVRFQLSLFSDRIDGDYPCTVRISGIDAEGNSLTSDIPIVVHIRDGLPNNETTQIVVSEDTSSLNIGEDGVIAVKLSNSSQRIGLENLSLTVSDPSGDILSKEMDTVALGNLMPGESIALRFPVTVLSNAKVSPHSLRLDFSGKSLGEEVKFSIRYTVLVRQEIRLEQGGLRLADSVVAGDSITATLPLMNMGKAEIVNAMVTLKLPGITEHQSVLVGTIQPGETRQAQITFTAPKDALGESIGSLTISGEDNDGNSVSFDLPVSLAVEEPVKAEALDAQEVTTQRTPTSVSALAIVCAILAAALIAQSVLLRNKIRRMEEERV